MIAAAVPARPPRRMSIRRLLALSRPRFWPYLIGPWAVGVAAAEVRPDAVDVLLGVYLTLPANLLIYGVNDLTDRATDRLNRKKGSYEALLDPSEDRRLLLAVLVTNAPFLALVPFLPVASTLWLAVFLVLGVGYSARPLRFKARPGWDSASNLLYAAPGFAGYAAASGGSAPPVVLVVAAGLWCAAMHAYSAVPDIGSDRGARLSTIATRLGARGTLLLCLVLWLAAAAIVAPRLPVFALVTAAVYGLLGALSLLAVSGARRVPLFGLYRAFPFVNTAVGGALFFSVLPLERVL